MSSPMSPFHAMQKACELSSYAFGRDRLVPAFAGSDVEVYPYQIAAARFALRSPYLKGAVLCDEGSLGKTFEALLIVAQRWYEGCEHILLIVPGPLFRQWQNILEAHFSVPYIPLDTADSLEKLKVLNPWEAHGRPFDREGIVLTTYDLVAERSDWFMRTQWELAVLEEAHCLRQTASDENGFSISISKAVGGAFKLLLTATPMQNSIMDLYNLIYFIDGTVFPDKDAFYRRYFRKPENYPELAERVSRYCFRTTRQEVENYVKIPQRLLITAEFELTPQERKLYKLLDDYVKNSGHIAFPKMDGYELALMLFRAFSSSSHALERTLRGVLKRVEGMVGENGKIRMTERLMIQHGVWSEIGSLGEKRPVYSPEARVKLFTSQWKKELSQIRAMHELAASPMRSAKAIKLQQVLKEGFERLKQLGAKQKALIFTENLATQAYLYSLLNKGPYKGSILTYNGKNSRDYSVMERFADDKKILISTDIGAEGFNLEFCSFVINYDLPYNTLAIEQRINRCHRQGQRHDVIIVNFLDRNNFADVRLLELINKRILQFSGVFGLSDDVLGNIGVDLGGSFSKVLGSARSKEEIDRAYEETLQKFEDENKLIVKEASQSLFTSFTSEISDKLAVTPQYIQDRGAQLNDALWALTKYFFRDQRSFRLDDATRTLSFIGVIPPKLFTGSRMGRNEYSMAKGYQPRSGRHTITGSLAKNIIRQMFWTGVAERGEIIVDSDMEPCTIGLYAVRVAPKNMPLGGRRFYPFSGKTRSGRMLSDEECREIMALPVKSVSSHGELSGLQYRYSSRSTHELDNFLSLDAFIEKTLMEIDSAEKEEIERLKARTAEDKVDLERGLDALRKKLRFFETEESQATARMKKLAAQKKVATARKELKEAEQNLFMNCLKLDITLEEQIKEFRENAKLAAEMRQLFVLQVKGT